MDCCLLKLLLKQAIFDIKDLVPKSYFNPWRTVEPHPKSHFIAMSVGLKPDSFSDRIVAIRASELGAKLQRSMSMLSARQHIACELLIPLGELIVIEIENNEPDTKPDTELDILLLSSSQLNTIKSLNLQRQTVIDNFKESLKLYFKFLTEQEAKPFISLLESDPEPSKSQAALLTNEKEDGEGRQIQQEDKILLIISSLGYIPLKLPPIPAGKPWVKSEVREKLNIPSHPFQSIAVFDKAWERLLKSGKIKVAIK
ncbi:MAG: hypothetical protein K2P74_08680 [Nitrosomonas sp.]|nr:hypothetical protein [Nitrosomonas sp.]